MSACLSNSVDRGFVGGREEKEGQSIDKAT
jgi:hypothetical protein